MLFIGTACQGFCYAGPDDPGAVKAARAAVFRLGPSRGGLDIQRCAIGIEASSPLAIKRANMGLQGLSAEVASMLNDLGAKKIGEKIQVSLSGDVLFDFDRWEIKKGAEKTLAKLVKAIKQLKIKEILIEGHTDSKGSKHYNLILSQRRAEAVKTWLVKKGGLTGVNIITKGYGESKPVAPNTHPDGTDNPGGRAKNRRVEIYVTLQGS